MRRLRVVGAGGLRVRLLAALLSTSAATLAVAALALLSPLEQRLRASSESSLLNTIPGVRTELRKDVSLNPRTHLPERREVSLALSLVRRQGAQAWLLNRHLAPVSRGAPADLDVPTYFPEVQQALLERHGIHIRRGNLFMTATPVSIGGARFVLVVIRALNFVTSAVGVVEGAFLEAAAAGLAIALLLGAWLTTGLLRRLRQLRDAARELERRGPHTALSIKPGNDEIGELARTFNSMRTRLAQQQAALRAFVATASHELRTPLASLDGLLELIDDDLDPNHLDLDDARQRTGRAREQSRRLSRLAGDLLDLSRLDAQVELRAEPLELSELARAVVAELELRAAEQNVTLKLHAPSGPAWVSADPGAVARIVRILIDNALRVSPRGAAVDIEVSTTGLLTISDHGPGVPDSERELIFERFRRGQGAAGHGGFGLGLAIGRELAVRMGGSLELLDGGERSLPGVSPGAHAEAPVPAGADRTTGARFCLTLPPAAGEIQSAAGDVGPSPGLRQAGAAPETGAAHQTPAAPRTGAEGGTGGTHETAAARASGVGRRP